MQPIPDRITSRLNGWFWQMILYIGGGVLLVLAGIVANAVIVVYAKELGDTGLRSLGLVAAICVTVTATFKPLEIGLHIRQAWKLLDGAVLQHAADPTAYPASTLAAAAIKGEEFIDKGLLPLFSAGSNKGSTDAGAGARGASAPEKKQP